MTNQEQIDKAQQALRALREELDHDRTGLKLGLVSYAKAAATAKAVSNALYEYSRLRFPNIKARRTPYQALLR